MNILSWFYYNIYSTFFPNSLYLLKRELRKCNNIIDLGCGSSSPIKYLRNELKYYLGVDRSYQSVLSSKKQNIHNGYLVYDLMDIDVLKRSFDCAISLDVIEHFHKIDGLKFIKKMETISKRKILILTPNGFIPQASFDNNRFQEHLSGYDYKEMIDMGFTVYGINGHKKLRGSRAEIKKKPRWIWFCISEFSQLYTYFFPKNAFHLFCIKYLRD